MKVKLFEAWTVLPCTGSMGSYTHHPQARRNLEIEINAFLANPAIKLVSAQSGVRLERNETVYSCMVIYDDAPAFQPKRITKTK